MVDQVTIAHALVLLVACGGGDAVPDAACVEQVLYLNRAGGDFARGSRDDAVANLSLLLDGPRTLPPWPYDDIDWTLLGECLRTSLAPFPIRITELDPSPAPHTEIVFTTAYWAGSAGTTMIVPDGCQPDHEVEFVFGNALPTRARACQVALIGYAQMRANLSLGDDCNDILNNAADCAAMRTFVDAEANCVDGSNQAAPCRCGGTTQNSFEAMRTALPACP